jgi:hypothetical protein
MQNKIYLVLKINSLSTKFRRKTDDIGVKVASSSSPKSLIYNSYFFGASLTD